MSGNYWRSQTIGRVLTYILLTILSLAMLVPFAWMLSTSLKRPVAIFDYPPQWIPRPPQWSNYKQALQALPFGRYYRNTFVMASSITVLQVITSSMAAYGFARLSFPGRDALFLVYIGTMMIPKQVTIIPNFIMMSWFGWINTFWGLIIPMAFTAFGTFMLRQFFLTVPKELEDSARIDGCGRFQTYWYIMLPLSKPALATLTIFAFMTHWNSFMWPLIITTSDDMRVLTLGLAAFRDIYETHWTLLNAAAIISLAPVVVVYLLGQQYFVEGITMTGLKG